MFKYLIFNCFRLQNEKKLFSIIEVPTFGPSHTQRRIQPQRWTHPQVTIKPSKNGCPFKISEYLSLYSLLFVITVPTHNSPYAPEDKHTNTNPYTPGKRRPPPPGSLKDTLWVHWTGNLRQMSSPREHITHLIIWILKDSAVGNLCYTPHLKTSLQAFP